VISWRYHLISIVAVFLAFGLGVLTGTTVLNDNLVRELKSQTRDLRANLDELRRTDQDNQSELARMNAFAEQALPYLVDASLTGEHVIVVTQEGVDGGALAETRAALDLAGADVITTLTAQRVIAAQTPNAQGDLASLLGLPDGTSARELATAAGRAVALRLATDPAAEPTGADLLGELLSQGFLTASAPEITDATLEEMGGRDQLVVVVGGTSGELSPTSTDFMVPLVQRLADLEVVAAVGESLDANDGFVAAIRSALDASAGPLVTVDNIDRPVGASAMALGLRAAIVQGIGGDYGVKPGATRLLPPVP
jgi:hypothetical protein